MSRTSGQSGADSLVIHLDGGGQSRLVGRALAWMSQNAEMGKRPRPRPFTERSKPHHKTWFSASMFFAAKVSHTYITSRHCSSTTPKPAQNVGGRHQTHIQRRMVYAPTWHAPARQGTAHRTSRQKKKRTLTESAKEGAPPRSPCWSSPAKTWTPRPRPPSEPETPGSPAGRTSAAAAAAAPGRAAPAP